MSTHYMAGGVPLAFTQEDFLVYFLRLVRWHQILGKTGNLNLVKSMVSVKILSEFFISGSACSVERNFTT